MKAGYVIAEGGKNSQSLRRCGWEIQVSAQALLCGDLNFPATAPERLQILAPFNDDTPNFHDAWSILHPGTPHAPTVGIHPVDFVDRPECFDFVFITDGLVNHLKAHGIDAVTEASDHQPVWVEFG